MSDLTRRRFLKGALAGAGLAVVGVPLVAKVLSPQASPRFVGEVGQFSGVTIHSYRDAARAALAEWFAKRSDDLTFKYLAGQTC
jgi:hypothetical protein